MLLQGFSIYTLIVFISVTYTLLFEPNDIVFICSSFKLFLEVEPQLRDIIFKFYESKYASCLKLLDELKVCGTFVRCVVIVIALIKIVVVLICSEKYYFSCIRVIILNLKMAFTSLWILLGDLQYRFFFFI